MEHLIMMSLSFSPAPYSVFTPIPAAGRTTASMPTSRTTPILLFAPARREVTRSLPVFSRSPAPEPPNAISDNDVALTPRITPQFDITLSYLTMPFSTKDHRHATTSWNLWTLQLEIFGEHLLQLHLHCSYDPTHQKEKHNRFLRHIYQT